MAKQKSQIPPVCQTFVDARKNPAVFLCLKESFALPHVLQLRSLLHDKTFNQIDLIIHSGGGDINATYQTIELLRMHTTVPTLKMKNAVTSYKF